MNMTMDARQVAAKLIETRHYCRIDFEFPEAMECTAQLEDELLYSADKRYCSEVALCLGAAHWPYIEFWSYSKDRAVDAVEKVLAILNREECELKD